MEEGSFTHRTGIPKHKKRQSWKCIQITEHCLMLSSKNLHINLRLKCKSKTSYNLRQYLSLACSRANVFTAKMTKKNLDMTSSFQLLRDKMSLDGDFPKYLEKA